MHKKLSGPKIESQLRNTFGQSLIATLYVKQNYQRRATRIYQEIKDRQERIIHKYDRDEAHSLQQPVDHVEPYRD